MSPSALITFLLAAVATAMAWSIVALLRSTRLIRAVDQMPDVVELSAQNAVAIITPACNEEGGVARAVAGFVGQANADGAGIQVVVVDDRSTDATGAIVDELAAHDPRIEVVHVTELPEQWLGKLHALEVGTRRAAAPWLLFIDADVRLEPHTLARVVHYAESTGLDFVTALPRVDSAGWLGDAAYAAMGAAFVVGAPIEAIRSADSPRYAGMGAFMLARREVFDRSGGFEWLRLEVADDMGLGLMMKKHGGRLDIVLGGNSVRLAWYADWAEMSRKMQKNWFGIVGRFSVARTFLVAAALASVALCPLLAAVAPTPTNLALAAAIVALESSAATVFCRWSGWPMRGAWLVPLGFLLHATAAARAAILGWRMGGIEWRGRVYPSAELRRHQRVRV